MISGLVAVIVIVGGIVAIQAKFKPYQESWQHMIHKDIACAQCHRGHLENTMKEVSRFYHRLIGNTQYKAEKVSPDNCAACHNGSYPKAKTVVSKGYEKLQTFFIPAHKNHEEENDVESSEEEKGTTNLKFVHKNHLEQGLNCIDCHRTVAHGTVTYGKSPFNPSDPQIPDTMVTFCTKCHDVRTREFQRR